jgi:virginiamycin B lyase
MKRLLLVLIVTLSINDLRAQISGYAVSTPTLDRAIRPRLVAAAPNGNVWFTEANTTPYSIGFFTPAGRVVSFPIPCTRCATGEEVVYTWDIEAGPDSSVWFIDNHARADVNHTSIASRIGHVTATGQFTFYPIPTSDATAIVPNGFGHSSLALAADGTVWFTENAASKAAKLTPSNGAIAEYPLEMPEQASGITIGNDGKIWYTAGQSEIAMITPPTNGEFVEFLLAAGAFPLGIATGSDGNIWIAESGRHRIARLSPSGIVAEFATPAPNSAPQHIVAAADRTLWYTESSGMNVGRITLNGTSAPTFETIATPGQQNFDITVSSNGRVYVTGTNASGQKLLTMLAPAQCGSGPFVSNPDKLTGTRSWKGTFAIGGGKDPLNITVQNLPATWTAQTGRTTTISSGAAPAFGTYTFTIAVTDSEGCSTSQQVTVRIADFRYRTGAQ